MRLIAFIFLCCACSGGGVGMGAEGEESGVCYPNSTCNMGLVCVNDKCESTSEGGEAGPCYPNETCDTGLVCLQDVCTPVAIDGGLPDAAQPVSCSSSSSFNFVLETLTIPENATQANAFGQDIDGDTTNDNALGGLLGAMSSTVDLDMQSGTNRQNLTGSFIQLLALNASDLTNSSSANVCSFRGDSPSIAPCVTPSNLDTCGNHLEGTASFSIASDTPNATEVAGSIASGVFSSAVSEATAFVALSFSDDMPAVLPLASARITATTSTDNLTSGLIGGGLSMATIDNIFIPAFALSLQNQITADCTPVGGDCGCVADSPGENILAFFDTNDDCSVPTMELRDNNLIEATLLNPDLDLLDADGNPGTNGVNDHLSVGFGFTAVSASF